MTLSNNDKKDIEQKLNSSERFILEKISGDRKSHAIQFQHLNLELNEIKTILKAHVINDEIYRIQLALLKKKTKTYDEVVECTKWTVWLYKHKKITLTIIAIFIFTFTDKLVDIYNVFKTKLFGL